jgi:iron complex transport system substrate-binding protein
MPTPRRVVSLSPNVSMILFALDADAAVVGCTQGCLPAIQAYLHAWRLPAPTVAQRLQHWQALPVVGVWPQADAAAVQALRPEAILTSGSGPFGVHAAEVLGVKSEAMHHYDTRTFADMERQIQQIGALLDRTPAAAQVLAQLQQRRGAAQARQRQRAVPPTVLFEYCVCTRYDPEPERRVATPAQTVLVGGHLAPELIQLSGGTPLLAHPGDSARWVTFEEIRAAQPEVILQYDCHGCPTAGKYPVATRHGWGTLPAVVHAAVYPLHENISDPNLCFPGPLEHLLDVLNTFP